MKLSDLIKNIRYRIPFFTDKFTDKLTPVSVSYDDTTSELTIDTDEQHYISDDDLVSLNKVSQNITVNNLDYFSNTYSAIATCDDPHDIVLNLGGMQSRFVNGSDPYIQKQYQDDVLVEINGADQIEFNGEKIVVGIIDEYTFEYIIIGAQPNVNTATGSIYFKKTETLFNGIFNATVLGAYTFKVTIVPPGLDYPTPITPPNLDFEIHVRHRITGAATLERAVASYTKELPNKLWMICIREGVAGESSVASQSRKTTTDAVATVGVGTSYMQNVIEKVSLVIFFPSTTSISGRQQRDEVEDLKPAIFKSTLGIMLPSTISGFRPHGLVYTSDETVIYNSSFYIHRINLETMSSIECPDIAPVINPIMLDKLDLLYYKEEFEDKLLMTDKIKHEKSN